jgi:choline kinase
MKVIILAAGQGQRLRPLSDGVPKSLVQVNGKSLLDRQLKVIDSCGISDISLVTGYQHEKLSFFPGKKFFNMNFVSTNMVYSLFCAHELFDGSDDVIVAYGDIIYSKEVLASLIAAEGDIAVVADREWQLLWECRMENPLDDAESFRSDEDGNVIELGKKINRLEEATAQYIGLFKISASVCRKFFEIFQNMEEDSEYDSAEVTNLYMTSYLQYLIDCKFMGVKACFIDGGWLEVDSVSDISSYNTVLEEDFNGKKSSLFSKKLCRILE